MSRRRKPSGRGRGRGYQTRSVKFREQLQRFLIVCEGERTEPEYFKRFRVPAVVVEVLGLGKDPLTLVERAFEEAKLDDFDQVWCVFDRDEVPADRFNRALDLAGRRKIEVAYSNQAFELWYLLHFCYSDVALLRNDYAEKVGGHLGRPYQKSDSDLYQLLLPRQADAIQNAERLLQQYHPPNPCTDDPSTTVFKLVRELNRFTQNKRFSS